MLLDLNLFPPELNLFGPESAWRINERMAIVNDAEENSLDQAEVILSLNGFRRRDLDEGILENYFILGDELMLEEALPEVVAPPAPPPPAPKAAERVLVEEEVIMPEVARPEGTVPTLFPSGIKQLEGEPPIVAPPVVEARAATRATDEGELIEHILAYIRSRGFSYPDRLVKDYYVCLKTKPFVILAGYSGMGKTALTRLVAEAVAEDVEEQYLRVSVQPDWLDDKGLLGFYNPLTGQYVSTPFLDFLLRAAENPDKPYFLCLDEMNLSRVEYYFSRFLSAMESLDRTIHLHGVKDGAGTAYGRLVPPKLKMPSNLFISGTINIDESTYPLSPKLLDRANTIEFFEVDLRGHPKAGEYRRRLTLDMETLNRFRGALQPSEEERVIETLAEVNEKTLRRGFPISYRVRREVLDYVGNSRGIYSGDSEENLRTALDLQVKQRVLTKIAGTESVRPLLEDLEEHFTGRLPLSAEKVGRMLKRLDENGFTNFYI